MGTNTQHSKPSTSKSNDSKQKLIAIAAVVIVALLAVNAWLLYKTTQASKVQATLTTQLDEVNVLQEELNEKYYEAKSELDALKGENIEMNALIAEKEMELKDQKDRIASLLRKGGSLDDARNEIAQLNQQVDSYLAELNQLRAQNELLAGENSQLTQERDQISNDLSTQMQTNATLNEERALLVSQREQLTDDNNQLSRKVNQASAIKVTNLVINGQKTRRSGKSVTRRSADNVEYLEIQFQTTVNKIAVVGKQEEFIVRILNPQGETMTINSLGSGTFTNEETGEPMLFTTKDVITYEQASDTLRFKWDTGQAFSPGKYTVEVYNKGFKVGEASMVLK